MMRLRRIRLLCIPLAVLLIPAAGLCGDEPEHVFERRIRPLLIAHCGDCHGPDVQEADLRLDARHSARVRGADRAIIVPGRAADSELIRRITADDPDRLMPPGGPALPADAVALLKQWIDAGAEWPETEYDRAAAVDPRRDHWSFQPLQTVEPPRTTADGTPFPETLSPIDRFVQFRLAEQGLPPAPRADRITRLRRLHLNMLGLPPTPEELDDFLADTRPDAFARRIDRVLASPRYGERWAQHWLDVVRYADTHGFEVNTPRENAWPYRDYVIRAFNDDTPWDAFIRQQLAGDVLGEDAATGFLVAAAVLLPGQIGKDEASRRLARQDELDEIVVGTSSAFLGLTIGCARCHDHKFDPVSQRDYYALQAFFAGVRYGDRPIRDASHERRLQEAEELDAPIRQLAETIRAYRPTAFPGRTLILDEQDERFVTVLRPPNGQGTNPEGTQRGDRDDPGTEDRLPNLSGGQYTWWPSQPGVDVLTWDPQVSGRFRLWLSWGVHGSGVHTRDARYLLDDDGDLATRNDQRELARIDQYYPAGIDEGETEKTPRWSGLFDAGVISLQPSSRLVLRCGDTGTGITADVIVLQETSADEDSPRELPLLREPVDPALTVERFPPVPARFVRMTILETVDDNRHEPCLDELEIFGPVEPQRNLARADDGAVATSSGNYADIGRHRLAHLNDGRYGNEHSWISATRGGGWACIELPQTFEINRIAWARDRTGTYRDRLPVRYRFDVSTDGMHWTRVADHSDRMPPGTPGDPDEVLLRNRPPDAPHDLPEQLAELQRLRDRQEQLRTPRQVYGGVFGTPDETRLLRRGDPEQPGPELEPRVPELFAANPPSPPVTDEERRRYLADWIASPDNPLTARVAVNRIWLHQFGQGLVSTPGDFGLNGARPSHPRLLDWLAGEFIRSGWSVKHVQRLILNSQAWQQNNRITDDGLRLDADNRWLWRFASRRLEAEAVRDSLLAVSGELNLATGGPGFDFFRTRGGLNGFPPVTEFGPPQFRRMIYAHKVRMEPVPVFGAFDCPDAGQPTARRNRSTTAIQALNLFNSDFVIRRAEALARRVTEETGPAPGDRIRRAFRLTLGREPESGELSAAESLVNDHGLMTVCRALLNSNEFLYLP